MTDKMHSELITTQNAYLLMDILIFFTLSIISLSTHSE